MLDVFLDFLKRIIKSRLFPLTFIYIALFSLLVHRLFVLQIVQGPVIAQKDNFRETQNREIKSTRGNIYDRNGKLLASNVLSYSVTMVDSTEIETNEERNAVIHRLINIIKDSGDTLYNDFPIIQTGENELEFTISGSALTRFKKNVYTFVLEDNKLTEKQTNASAKEVYEFLKHGTGDNYTDMFGISDEYTISEALDIMSVRYALHCNYPKFLRITIANKVNDNTVAHIMENSAYLPGVEIQQMTQRVYHDSIYFAHMLGYTGQISAEELELLNVEAEYYNTTDIIGKTGLEKKYEEYLRGEKGTEIVTVNPGNKVIDVVDRMDPVAGNDIYLTIDSDLQKATYHILEKKIAGILLSKIVPNLDYGSKGESASEITTPIYEVYYALINNNIIDITRFSVADENSLERQTYDKYKQKLEEVFAQLDVLLAPDNTVPDHKAGEMEEYLKYFYEVLVKNGILLKKQIPEDDEINKSYLNNKTTLNSFLNHAISNNYIDLSKLGVKEGEFYTSEELYRKLLDTTKEILKKDGTFNKKIYRDLVFSYKLSGKEICLLLFDQGVLEYNEEDRKALENGDISAYNFMRAKITSLEITPAMLALEPCSGSVVITDVQTGDVLAMVTYPSYDNNKLANKADPEYYNWLFTDKSLPWMNRPMQQLTAPGSTFKMVTAFAGLMEGVISPGEKITDLGIYEKIQPAAKCHIYPRSHGSVDITDAIRVSCNYFFYELGFRLSVDGSGKYNEQIGLNKLKDYAAMFGLDSTSGVELSEAQPKVSDDDPVRSSIGQGTNAYTPIQLSRYVTTLANRGINYDLTLLDRIVDKDGNIKLKNKATIYKGLTEVNPAFWDAVQEGMYSVANVPGGSVNSLYKNLGVTVAGKTGTSQISKVNFNNALFVSYAPYQNPEISVTAVIPNGYTSGNAAELARDVYRLYFDLEDPEALMEKEASLPENNIAAFSD